MLSAAGLALACLPAQANCPAPAPVHLDHDPQRLDEGVEVLFDAARRYQPADVERSHCSAFQSLQGTPRFAVEPRGIWLRLRLPPLADNVPWRLLVPFVGADRFCAHWPLGDGGYDSQCGDLTQPLNRTPYTEQGWYFRVPPTLDTARPVLLYLEGRHELEAPLEFGSADAFVRLQHQRQTAFGLLYGALLAAIVLGLMMYVHQRDRAYLHFAGLLAAVGGYVGLRENHLSALGLTGQLAHSLLPIALGLVYVSGTRFHQSFLDTATHTPRLHRLQTLSMLLTVVPNFGLWLLHPWLGAWPIAVANSLWLVVAVLVISRRWRQGFRPARYLLVAALLLAIAAALRLVAMIIPSPVEPRWINALFYAGMACSAVFMMIALVSRIRELMQERDAAHELVLSNQRLALHRAQYDPVTRLPNAVRFREELQALLGHGVQDELQLALLTLSLDHFSALNYSFGSQIGDSVLEEISLRLQEFAGPGSLLARTGADLFAWLVPLPPEDAGIDALRQRCQSLQARLAAPLDLGSGTVLTASVGIALYPQHASTAERLLQCSDAALHSARLQGPGSLRVYQPALHHRAARDLELSTALRRALERDELELHYQPIIALGSGELLGVEALARWHRGDGHHVPPDQFLPVAEAGDLLRPFTEWGLRTASRQLADWLTRRVAIRYVSFNLSAHQLRLDGIEALVLDALQDAGVPPERFALEVTEGTLMENLEASRALLSRFRSAGIAVAVDDFGVGYASPHYLRVLPVDILKLDGVFLRGVPHEGEANSVLDSLITLGHSLRLRIITEGIETEAQASYVTERGVSGGQGFWYAPPLPADALEAWLGRPAPRELREPPRRRPALRQSSESGLL